MFLKWNATNSQRQSKMSVIGVCVVFMIALSVGDNFDEYSGKMALKRKEVVCYFTREESDTLSQLAEENKLLENKKK